MTVMTEFTTDLQHSGMVSKDLDATIDYYTNKIGFKLVGRTRSATTSTSPSCVMAI